MLIIHYEKEHCFIDIIDNIIFNNKLTEYE